MGRGLLSICISRLDGPQLCKERTLDGILPFRGHLQPCPYHGLGGDAAIIEFGHNDQKKDERGTEPFSRYAANLIYMAARLREKGIDVYFVTSVPRRKFKNGRPLDSHKDYIAAMKWAGHQISVPVIDITIPLMMDLAVLGDGESKKYYMNFGPGLYENYPEGKDDNTHLRPEGALWVAGEIASHLKALDCPFMRR